MTLPRLLCTALLASACTPGAKSLGQGETGEASSSDGPVLGSESTSAAGDGATSMFSTDDGTDTGPSCGPAPLEPCDPTTDGPESTSSGASSEASSDGAESSDTSVAVCEIVDSACELADQSKSRPIDCGDITTADPVDAWQAAHECALDAATVSAAFKLIVDMQGIDSFPRRAFVGMEGVAYQLIQLDQDFGGIVPGPTPVNYRYCDVIVATPACTPSVGDICITCMGQLDGDVLCEP